MRRSARQTRAGYGPLLAGVAVAFVVAIAYWIPQPWGDEAATLSAADRSVPDLLRMLQGLDAVHGVYYLAAHVLVQAIGPSVAAVRALSVVAVGVAAGGLFVLGRRLVDRRFAVVVVTVFATIPQVTWAATEARSSALVVAASVWSTVALLQLLARGLRRDRVLYAVLAAAGIAVNVYLLLLVAAQVLAVLVVPAWRRRMREVVVPALGAIIVNLPLLLLVTLQRSQVDWIPPLSAGTVRQLTEHQWFGDDLPYAAAAWMLMTAGFVVAVRVGRRQLVVLCTAGLLVPSSVLVIMSAFLHPLYVPRYTASSLPFVALLIAAGLRALPIRPLVVVVALIGALSLPSFVGQRLPDAKGTGWSQAAERMRQLAAPGQAVDVRVVGFRVLHEKELGGFVDVARRRSQQDDAGLWDRLVPPSVAARRVLDDSVVVVTDSSAWTATADGRAFLGHGFAVARTERYGQTTVLVLRR